MSDSRLAEATEPRFARHETFAPRYGWLYKAHTEIVRDGEGGSDIFHRENAPVLLGVGRNMVNAIRFWSQAFKLTREHPHPDPSNRAYIASPTWRAEWLLGKNGADPYLEDTGSLWLLHWWLLSSEPGEQGAKCMVPSWYVMFNLAPFSKVTTAEMITLITRHVNESYAENAVPAAESIKRDVDCLIKMYALDLEPNPQSQGSFEDQLMSPFRELGLLEGQGKGKSQVWRFTTRSRVNLPAAVLLYACLDYASHVTGGNSISLARLANEPGAPGRAFRMREPELIKVIEPLVADQGDVWITDSLGQRSLSFAANPQELAWEILDRHYGHVSRQDGFPIADEWKQRYPGLKHAGKGRKREQLSEQPGALELIEEQV
ncbi:DUF4007 family protein [Streptosporangium roseum]|uniref:DUF4007 domain-containing protein n=1 Tax=Streptosporangium roseum (strain ATCC 12428 / DSM 43021 / JCM 3005 / KCTC 9067 / NCIMB 10171 / NRRL 2505 / NI 9100) TaxID=479432 RepID=D2B493_STRRD|nr:DUF4007 family protein [Streptosporangium roseum]ACZ91327.1 hypothetical protein Sros_8686 [Streptosporangium roseum DSM 43021]